MTEVLGVVLAAGASSRMGRPKALLPFDGRTAVEILSGTLRACGLDVVAVVEPGSEPEAEVARIGVPSVRNPIARLGRTGSVQFGWREARPGTGILVAPVDCPLVKEETCRALLARAGTHAIVRPVHAGRGGHPLLLAPELRGEVLALAPNASLRTVLHLDPRRRLDVEVDDPEILTNLDTPQDYGAALARFVARGSA